LSTIERFGSASPLAKRFWVHSQCSIDRNCSFRLQKPYLDVSIIRGLYPSAKCHEVDWSVWRGTWGAKGKLCRRFSFSTIFIDNLWKQWSFVLFFFIHPQPANDIPRGNVLFLFPWSVHHWGGASSRMNPRSSHKQSISCIG
jgi:hypothetical protein